MKKIILFLVVLIIVGGGYLFLNYSNVEAPKIDEQQINNVDEYKSLNFSSSTKEVAMDFYNIKFDFPVTENEKINQEINRLVDETISSFEKDAVDFGPMPSDVFRPYTLFGQFEAHLGQKYDSFVFLISMDFGGAHPNHFYKTLTFDKDGKVLSLSEFLNIEFQGKDVIGKISELAQKKLLEKLAENANAEMIKDGAGPSLENFRNFYYNEDEIVFLFEPYAVAPYAYSSQEARIKISEIF